MDTYIWLALMVAFLVVEASCPIHLVSIWFAVGSLAATVVTLLDGQVWVQLLVFAATSGGLLVCLWPFTRKFLKPRIEKTNVDSVLGTRGYATGDIDNLQAQGRVKLGGMEWTARSADGQPIKAGTLVEVVRIEGVKAFVTPVENAD